jgi:SAM-dependent methyltransferase
MDECKKTNALRSEEFVRRYIRGRIIDIGAGDDLVTPHAEPFDIEHGDANRILEYREPRAYDCVHSSHCLEHMWSPRDALAQWWGLVKPGGHLVVIVPEENLYEQGYWPSLFNPDHKASFRLGGSRGFSPVSNDIRALCAELPGGRIVEAEVQSAGYSMRLHAGVKPATARRRAFSHLVARVRARLLRTPRLRQLADPLVVFAARLSGLPVDQTLGSAVAQIQIVVAKES